MFLLVTDSAGRRIDIIDLDNAGGDVKYVPGLISPGFVNAHCHVELSHLKDDKVDVHKRVTGLIDAIEKWEKEYTSPGEEGVSAEADSPESGHDQETVS